MADVDNERREFWLSQPAILDSMVFCDNPLLHEADTEYMVQYLPPIAGKSVLELGAGIGKSNTATPSLVAPSLPHPH
ncbi:hypothetical protein Pcinc_020448 [Petrolisthes cinctipes]|uniref:Uncharacterized protein n=1 Tax=Petrolisthes cinctipes TaxID=88211 RepID=A0AAE1KJ33_PETCI|nr:hypothetical protein Pcinc_020448 [Petrolisthes cinctipes]